jgi:hypothetical protein
VTDGDEVSELEQQRLEATLTSIPSDAKTGLEIGFSDLRMTRLLATRLDLVSIDLPHAHRRDDSLRLLFADIVALPFRNRSFDIVICAEVLEHLPSDVLMRGVAELQRVSDKYLLVSVPYKQRVWNERFKCNHCGYVGNVMSHLHYFDEKRLEALLDRFVRSESRLVGSTCGYAPDVLYTIASNAGNSWYRRPWLCPSCHVIPDEIQPNLAGEIVRRIIWRLERLSGERACWLVELLERSD